MSRNTEEMRNYAVCLLNLRHYIVKRVFLHAGLTIPAGIAAETSPYKAFHKLNRIALRSSSTMNDEYVFHGLVPYAVTFLC